MVLLVIAAVIVLASMLYRADLNYLQRDYEEWKRNRK